VAKRSLLKRSNEEFHDPDAAIVTLLLRWPFDGDLDMLTFRFAPQLPRLPVFGVLCARVAVSTQNLFIHYLFQAESALDVAVGLCQNKHWNAVCNRNEARRTRGAGTRCFAFAFLHAPALAAVVKPRPAHLFGVVSEKTGKNARTRHTVGDAEAFGWEGISGHGRCDV
jgi:hypothetical protein